MENFTVLLANLLEFVYCKMFAFKTSNIVIADEHTDCSMRLFF